MGSCLLIVKYRAIKSKCKNHQQQTNIAAHDIWNTKDKVRSINYVFIVHDVFKKAKLWCVL